MRRTAPVVAVLAAAVMLLALAPTASAAIAKWRTMDVLFVGNNWDGTADVINVKSFKRIARLNIIPDKEERLREIAADPDRQAYFLGIRQLVGEGNDQYVDDMFAAPHGRLVFVSRPSFADVVAISLSTRKIVWRVPVAGYRADHMALSPDGTRLLVSASTARVVHVIDVKRGSIVANFPSGDQPHENNYSADGKTIFHASIGSVFTPTDDPLFDAAKGERVFQIVDGQTYAVKKRIDMGQKLREYGRSDLSGAVRPMAVAPDERWLYFQVSFFHGFVEYDMATDKVTRLANLPVSEEASKMRREEYLLDSAHHGLAMNPAGKKLCVAGTMSDYAAIVDRASFAHKIVSQGSKPYWSTNSGDGKYCFISYSGDDAVSVVSYAKEREVARFAVGDHPQRMRMGKLYGGLLGTKKIVRRAQQRPAQRQPRSRDPRFAG